MKIQSQIIKCFENIGYTDVRINLWRKHRLYINYDGESTYISLGKSIKLRPDRWSDETLCDVLDELIPCLGANMAHIKDVMGDGQIYRHEDGELVVAKPQHK